MKGHPGGEGHTLKMIELSRLPKGAKVLDMGAGAGETVTLLNNLGYNAVGIDIDPRGENVLCADMLNTDYPEECFDGIISQCAFFVSGNVEGALREAHRILKPGGVLMLSDVWFFNCEKAAEQAGFTLLHREDMTPSWREYYLEALWREEVTCPAIKGKCSYEMLICRKD